MQSYSLIFYQNKNKYINRQYLHKNFDPLRDSITSFQGTNYTPLEGNKAAYLITFSGNVE